MNAAIRAHLIDADDFERMKAMAPENVASLDTYEAFVAWNTQCVNMFSANDATWAQTLIGLCTLLKTGKLKMVDMESCGEWNASGFYFNASKTLVLVHPR